jgi:anti-sigma regulatory factor (Ser/Thr protein kinase)/DNA-binding XRE family transcriptional regulator
LESWGRSVNVGNKLKEVRRVKGMSLRYLAKRANVSASFLSQVEQGKCQPSLETLGRISTALGVSVEYFLREKEKTPKDVLEITLPNQLKYLSVLASLITEAGRVHHIDRRNMEDILLAVDETCTNIIKYAYDVGSLAYFTVRLTFDPGMIQIEFRDNGKPFNPLDATLPNRDRIREGEDPGGLGIFLIQKLMDRTEYRYGVDTGNCLTLVKSVSLSRKGET